ncbi:MAG TPA: PEGA domain-containing protein, partial [Vicinamibacterales bacterium]|nr:PEGA domain-containing protein [Vicinamibacterales bacterium]
VVNAPITTALDGFGRRTSGVDADTGDQVALLDLAPELVEHAGFVTALGERVARFAAVRHASYARVRRLDRPAADRLELVSDDTPGRRLSDLLAESASQETPVDITVVIALLRQLLPAVALYGRHNRDAAIGTLAPERLIVTPQGRLVIAEHVFGPALEKLNLGRDRLWRDFRVSMPPSAGLPRANQRADAHAIGIIALSLLLGRMLTLDEFPSQLPNLVQDAKEHRDGQASPLSPAFASWLNRALQINAHTGFQAPSDAQLAFESVLASDRSYVTSSTHLEKWIASVRVPEVPGVPEVPEVPQVQDARTPEVYVAPVASVAPAFAPKVLVLAAALVIALLLGVIGWLSTRDSGEPQPGEGELVVTTRAPGASVAVDGKPAGVTPLTITLSSGAHVVEVKVGAGEPRVVPVMIRAGVQTAQYVEMPEPLLPPKPPAEKSRKR